MSEKRKILEAIQRISGTFDKDIPQLIICTVDSFDLETQTCECTPVGGDSTTTIPGVQLKAEPNDGILIIPKIGSTVIVAFSLKTSAYIFMFSDIDSVDIIIPSATVGGNPTRIKIEEGKITFNDGTFDGLVKVNDLVTKLNNLENKVNSIIAIFNAHVHSGVTTGAGSSAISPTPVSGTLTATVKNDVENGLITHGK